MSASKRRKPNLVEEESTDSEITSDEDDDPHPDSYTGEEEVEIDFEGRAPIDSDCHGISQLLQRVFLKAHINCMQMAELVIAQNFVGSVICQCESEVAENEIDDDISEDGTIFGVTTVLNITDKKDVPCIKQFRTFIMQKAEKHASKSVFKQFRDILGNETRPIAYLINERFINIPAQISIPALENLYKDITSAQQKGMPYKFVHFLMVIKFYRKEVKKGRPNEDTYSNAEEELLVELSDNSFEYSVADECDTAMSGDWLEDDATLIPFRKVILFDGNNFPELILDIQKFITGK